MARSSPSRTWTWAPVALGFAAAALLRWGRGVDEALFLAINGWASRAPDLLWAIGSNLGDGLYTLVLLLPWIRRRPRRVWTVALGIALAAAAGQVLKFGLDELRPVMAFPPGKVHVIGTPFRLHSFPSGHAAAAFCFAAGFALTGAGAVVRGLLAAGALFVGVSRIACGVHWPVDVAFGIGLGWLAAIVASRLADPTRAMWTGAGPKIVGGLLLAGGVALLAVNYTGFPGIMLFQRIYAAVLLSLGAWEFRRLILED